MKCVCVVLQRMKILTTPWRDTVAASGASNGVVQSESRQHRLCGEEEGAGGDPPSPAHV